MLAPLRCKSTRLIDLLEGDAAGAVPDGLEQRAEAHVSCTSDTLRRPATDRSRLWL